MGIRVGINGFGRIGRMFLKAAFDRELLEKDIDIVAIADIVTDADDLAYQFKFDSIHGKSPHAVSSGKSIPSRRENDLLVINGHSISCIPAAPRPEDLPWKALGVDVVIEATGLFTHADQAAGHLAAGARKVIITAPAQGNAKTIVMGINEKEYEPKTHHVLSAASCTAHCLALPVHVLLREGIGIETGLLTAINSYTGSQRLTDGYSKRERRMRRAAAVNIIPSNTNAAKLAWEVFPSLSGKLSGISFRVPTPDVSLVDFHFRSEKNTSIQEIDQLMKTASETYLHGYLGYGTEELVSSDFIQDNRSSIYDSPATLQSNIEHEKRMFRIIAWYDNEWGYASRLADLLRIVASGLNHLVEE